VGTTQIFDVVVHSKILFKIYSNKRYISLEL